MVRDPGGGEVMETRWGPPIKAEVREIAPLFVPFGPTTLQTLTQGGSDGSED